jgi:3-oxoacyl-[acyl-carrier-protein] synthase-3
MVNTVITATGSYLPEKIIPNNHFLDSEFYSKDGNRLERPNSEIIKKLLEITGIRERRYVTNDLTTSDIACFAAEKVLENIDKETLDYIIVAQNLGEVKTDNPKTDIMPTLASRVKHKLKIKNPYTVAFDLPFGCPGWLQGAIIADYYIKSGDAKRILVIGAEILSRMSDPHDVDKMIFADGAGAALFEPTCEPVGIISHLTRSDTLKEAYLLRMDKSYNPILNRNDLFVRMDGHEIYKYALKTVPLVIKKNLEKANLHITDIRKVLLHQANEKMDAAILQRLFRLFNINEVPPGIMPMILPWTGNSSVATLPTLFDMIMRKKLDNHYLKSGDNIVFSSVGAGMNINSIIYRMP